MYIHINLFFFVSSPETVSEDEGVMEISYDDNIDDHPE